MSDPIRMRKHLDTDVPAPALPAGTQFAPLAAVVPQALHAILTSAYATGFGSIPAFAEWWTSLIADSEFDPALVFIVTDSAGSPIGVAQCWASGYVKDIAVSSTWRGQGVGEAMLVAAFRAFQQRGVEHVDLKVVAGNDAALRLYRRVGMIEVPL